MTRRILRDIRIEKIAAVDKPCQQGAIVAIMKRAPSKKELSKMTESEIADLEKRVDEAIAEVDAALGKAAKPANTADDDPDNLEAAGNGNNGNGDGDEEDDDDLEKLGPSDQRP